MTILAVSSLTAARFATLTGVTLLRGIDVSHYQGVIDWDRVARAGISFAYVKTTEGVDGRDPRWAANRSGARAAGVHVGGYHYAQPGAGPYDARAEAQQFLAALGPQAPLDLPPALDLEEHHGLPARQLIAWAVEFLTYLDSRSMRPPVLYTGPAFYTEHLDNTRELDRWPLWIAHYTPAPRPAAPRPWTFWQHTSAGRVPGISTAVDLDRFNGDQAALAALLGQTWEEYLVRKLPTLRKGDHSEDVGTAQALANARGAALVEDNVFGEKTEAAMLRVTGQKVVDHTAWAKLLRVS